MIAGAGRVTLESTLIALRSYNSVDLSQVFLPPTCCCPTDIVFSTQFVCIPVLLLDI
jgi:hypothetical protein